MGYLLYLYTDIITTTSLQQCYGDITNRLQFCNIGGKLLSLGEPEERMR
jgi:hypothetical protein